MQISYVVDVFKAILVWRLVQEWIFVSSIAQEMQYFLKSLDKLITLEFPHTMMVRSLTQTTYCDCNGNEALLINLPKILKKRIQPDHNNIYLKHKH